MPARLHDTPDEGGIRESDGWGFWILFLDASSLPDQDTYHAQDPYVLASLGGAEVRTKPHYRGGASPVWNELLEMKPAPRNNGILRLELWDKDMLKDDFIGFGEIDLSTLRRDHARFVALRLQDKKGLDAGYLRMEMYFRHRPKTLSSDQSRLVEQTRDYHGYFSFVCRRGSQLALDRGRKRVLHPFVVAKCGSSEFTTGAHRYGGSDPVWNQGIDLPFKKSDRTVHLEVRDKGYDSALIGTTSVDVASLLQKPFNVLVLQLKGPTQEPAGLLYVEQSMLIAPRVVHDASPISKAETLPQLYPPSSFSLRCINGEKLPSHDTFRAQDPYVKATIGDCTRQTRAHNRGGSNPQWNEVLQMEPSRQHDGVMKLEVWDSDMLRDDLIGRTDINIGRHLREGGVTPLSIPLVDNKGRDAGRINCELDTRAMPMPRGGGQSERLYLKCIDGRDLPQQDVFHNQDPFVTLKVGSQTAQCKPHMRGGANPVWNEVISVPFTPSERVARVEAWDYDSITKNDFIGGTDVDLRDVALGEASQLNLKLRDAKGRPAGTLNVIMSTRPLAGEAAPVERTSRPAPAPVPKREAVPQSKGREFPPAPLWLVCLNGEQLTERDVFHAQDPYIKASIGNATSKTKPHYRGGASPKWNEVLPLMPTAVHNGLLRIEAWDADKITRDDLIGAGEIDLGQFLSGPPVRPIRVPLKEPSGKSAGFVNCRLHLDREPEAPSAYDSRLFLVARDGADLPSHDTFHAQDPFVTFTIGNSSVSTNTCVRGGANPRWNQLLEIPYNNFERTLRVEAFDYDEITRNDLIGVAEAPVAEVLAREGQPYQFRLRDRNGKPAGVINCIIGNPDNRGSPHPTPISPPIKGSHRVWVACLNGRDLPSRDTFHAQDPYVKILVGGQEATTKPHYRGGANPVWNEVVSLPFSSEDRRLRIETYDKDKVTRDDLIGYTEMDLSSILQERQRVHELRLRDEKGKPAGILNCEVSVVGPPEIRQGAARPAEPYPGRTIWVKCINGADLPDHDTFHKQDPYVKVAFGDASSRTKTHERGGSSPVWNEVLRLSPKQHDGVVHFEAWDADTLRDDLIGSGRLDISPWMNEHMHPHAVELRDKKGAPAGVLNVEIHLRSEPQAAAPPAVAPPPQRVPPPAQIPADTGKLWMTFVNAEHLPSMDVFHAQDPYVKAIIGKSVKTTKPHMRGGISPTWNETLEMPYDPIERRIRLEVWDADKVTRDDLIGTAELNVHDVIRSGRKLYRISLHDKKNRDAGILNCEISTEPPTATKIKPFWLVVRNGEKLPQKDVFHNQDPYVKASIGACTKQTKPHQRGGASPLWNEVLFLDPGRAGDPVLSLEAWDADKVTKDDFIGEGRVLLTQHHNTGTHLVSVPLNDRSGRDAGVLNCEVHYDVEPKVSQLDRRLYVTCVNGADLPSHDVFHKQDPYVRAIIGPNSATTKPHYRGGKNPVWNETIEVPYNSSEKQLRLEAWDADTVTKDDFIGSTQFDIVPALAEPGVVRSYKLVDEKGRPAGVINCSVSPMKPEGNARPAERVPPPASQAIETRAREAAPSREPQRPLWVVCHNGQGLPQQDWFHAQDPYVKVFLGNASSQTKPHMRGGASPTWNEVLEVIPSAPHDGVLRFEAWDSDKVTRDDFIGMGEVNLRTLPPDPFQRIGVHLRDKKGRDAGVINCEVHRDRRPDMKASAMTVWLACINGANLPSRDVFHAQDPYVKATVGTTVRQTKPHMRGGATPVWNEVLELPCQPADRTILVEAYDYDRVTRDDLIGRTEVPLSQVLSEPQGIVRLELRDDKSKPAGFINCMMSARGPPHLQAPAVPREAAARVPTPSAGYPPRQIALLCKNAVDLPSNDYFRAQDPYVKAFFGNATAKTRVHNRGGATPVWDEVLQLNSTENHDGTLRCEVWDSDMMKDDLIGTGTISIDPTLRLGHIDQRVQLRDKKGNNAGILNCDVIYDPNETRHPPPAAPAAPVPRPAPDAAARPLWIACLNGANLPSHDVFHAQDPFVKAIVGSNSDQTKPHMRGGANPVWNQVLKVSHKPGEKLRLEVYDYDRITRNDLIGFCDVPIDHQSLQRGGRVMRFDLQDQRGRPAGVINCELSMVGPPEMRIVEESSPWTVTGQDYDGSLHITCIDGRDLPSQDYFHAQDPFVKVTVGRNTAQTKPHLRGGANPVWNEVIEIPYRASDRAVLFEAFDYDKVTANDLIGSASLSLDECRESDGAPLQVKLRDAQGKPAGVINCRIASIKRGASTPRTPKATYEERTFWVVCRNGAGLPQHDVMHNQDPYVKLMLGRCERKTRVHQRGGASPVWNEVLRMEQMGVHDGKLRVEAWDSDKVTRDDLIGVGEAHIGPMIGGPVRPVQIRLIDTSGRDAGCINLEIHPQEPTSDTLRTPEYAGRLWVACLNGRDLPSHDVFHAQDPFVKVTCGHSCATTKPHMRGGANPVWNEVIEVPYRSNDRTVLVEAFDYDKVTRNDLIGSSEVSIDDIKEERIRRLQIPLRDSRGKPAGVINCEMSVFEKPAISAAVPPKPEVHQSGRPAPAIIEPPTRPAPIPERRFSAIKYWLVCKNATDLPSQDTFKKQDPYLKATIGKFTAKTKAQRGAGATPVWNETLCLNPSDGHDGIMRVEVYDEDYITRDDLIGSGNVDVMTLMGRPRQAIQIPLRDSRGRPAGVVNCDFYDREEAAPVPTPVAERRLWVACLNGSELPSQDLFHAQDPFVKITVGKKSAETKPHMRGGATPVWNEVISVPFTQNDRHVLIEAYDYDRVTKSDFIGSAQVGIDAILQQPTRVFRLPLQDKKGRPAGFINCEMSAVQAPVIQTVQTRDVPLPQPRQEAGGPEAEFWVVCNNAVKLPSQDWFGAQDPYVKVIIGTATQQTSPHMKGGTSPVWNEVLCMRPRAGHDNTCRFEVWDADKLTKDDLIGTGEVYIGEMLGGPPREMAVPLFDKSKRSAGTLNCQLHFLADPRRTGAFVTPTLGEDGRLEVLCISGADLPSHDVMHAQDPYVKATVGRSTQSTTPHYRGGAKPVWNQTLELPYRQSDGPLLLEVFDKDTVTKDDLIGTASIPLSDISPNERRAYRLGLRDKKNRPAGYLNLEVRSIPASGSVPSLAPPGPAFRPTVPAPTFQRDFGEPFQPAPDPRSPVRDADRYSREMPQRDVGRSWEQPRVVPREAPTLPTPPAPPMPPHGKVWVACLAGRDLPSRDVLKSQDPYVLGIIGKERAKTKPHIRGGAKPVWNELLEIPHGANDRMLRLEVWDYDLLTKDDLIGFAEVPLADISREDTNRLELQLKDARGKTAGYIDCEISAKRPPAIIRGGETPKVSAQELKSKLWVACLNASGLPLMDIFFSQDPYVKVTVGVSSKRTLCCKDGGREPAWNDMLEIPHKPADRQVRFDVFDSDRPKTASLIGSAEITIAQVQALQCSLYLLQILDHMGKATGVLRCLISPLMPPSTQHVDRVPLPEDLLRSLRDLELSSFMIQSPASVNLKQYEGLKLRCVYGMLDQYLPCTPSPSDSGVLVTNAPTIHANVNQLKQHLKFELCGTQKRRNVIIAAAEVEAHNVVTTTEGVLKVLLTRQGDRPTSAGCVVCKIRFSDQQGGGTPSHSMAYGVEAARGYLPPAATQGKSAPTFSNEGCLRIANLRASDLKQSYFQSPRLYAKCSIGNISAVTDTQEQRGSEVTWIKPIEVMFQPRDNDLRVEIWSEGKTDEFVGFGTIAFRKLVNADPRKRTLIQLVDAEGVDIGDLEFSTAFEFFPRSAELSHVPPHSVPHAVGF